MGWAGEPWASASMGEAHKTPAQQMGGDSLSVPSPEGKQGQAGCHHTELWQRGHIHLASPRDLLWAGPEQHWGEVGNGQSHPAREMDSKFRELLPLAQNGVSMLLLNSDIFLLLLNVDCIHSAAIF